MKVSLHQLKQGNHAGYKIRWWQNRKRKEAYRKSYENVLVEHFAHLTSKQRYET